MIRLKKRKIDRKFYLFVCLLVVGVLLLNIGIHEFVPSNLVILHSNDVSLALSYKMYLSNFAHFNNEHIVSNLTSFIEVIFFIIVFGKFVPSLSTEKCSERRDIFYLIVLTSLTILPLVVSFNVIVLWIINRVYDGSAGGFSGIVSAYLGYCLYLLCRPFKQQRAIYICVIILMLMVAVGGWFYDFSKLGVGSANSHLMGFIFGFGLFWLMDSSGIKDLSPWLPKILLDKDWL